MSIKIGIIGFGCIGTGVVKILLQNQELITNRTGETLEIKKICDLDTSSDRGTNIDLNLLTNNANEILDDPEIKIIVELIGGIEPAKTFLKKALKNGKHVVTANKKLLAENGSELFTLAQQKNLMINFEAAVAGAIPIIRTIKESFAAEKIEKIYGILNGTTNYILTKLEQGGSYQDILTETQSAGYAEADPTADVEGLDAAHKIKLIAQLAFGIDFDLNKIYTKGITKLSTADFEFAKTMHYKIKLLAFAINYADNFDIRVEPVLLKKRTELANIRGVTNAVLLQGDKMNSIMLTGPGAGELPTASVVVGDIIEIAREIKIHQKSAVPLLGYQSGKIKKIELQPFAELENKYYLRVDVVDQPGVLAQVSRILADLKISINAVVQNPTQASIIPFMLTVHPTTRTKMEAAAVRINQLQFITQKAFIMPIEDNLETE